MERPSPEAVRSHLLRWFDASKRDLPWRRTRDPYRIFVAEYLLQRTRVASGAPYYERFLERFPDVRSLAAASEDEVLRAWEGLGFYRRARNLHQAARVVVEKHGGQIPETAAELEELPGIGPYTAGAVASIAFGKPVAAVDGNVTRVLSRLFRIEVDVTKTSGWREVWSHARALIPASRPGSFNQALMELGATICTPASPRCGVCPVATLCLARAAGIQESLPRGPRARGPRTVPVVFAHIESRGRILLVRRPDSGLLAGLWSLPGGEFYGARNPRAALRDLVKSQTGLDVEIGDSAAPVARTFSHRRWVGMIYRCRPLGNQMPDAEARWVSAAEALRLPMVPFHRTSVASIRTRHGPAPIHGPA